MTLLASAARRVAELLVNLCLAGYSSRTVASAVATLHGVLRYALRNDRFDEARHLDELRVRMAASPFAALLEPDPQLGGVVLPIAG